MARLRSRLIGGGGQPEVGFGSGVAQGLSDIASQIAAQYNPDVQMARQMKQLQIQAMQGQLEAAQEAEQARAGYGKLGEEMFPAGGRTQQVELGGQEPEQAPVTMPQTTPLSPNERLLKALIQSGNQRAIEHIALQQQAEPAAVVDLGNGQRGIRQPRGNITVIPNIKEPADKTLNPNDLAAFVSSEGALRGPSIPPDMTPEQGKAALENIRSIAQQKISIQAPFYAALGAYRNAQTQGLYGQLPVNPATIGNYSDPQGRNPQADPRFANPADRTQENLNQAGYRTLDTQSRTGLRMSNIATTQLDRMDKMVDELYKGVGPGANLGNAIKLKAQYAAAVGLIREFNTLRNETMPAMALSSGLTAGRVGEQIVEKIEKPMLPNDTDSYNTAKGKIRQLRQRLENNARVFYGTGIDRQYRVRDKGTGATGTLRLSPGELVPDNYEVQR